MEERSVYLGGFSLFLLFTMTVSQCSMENNIRQMQNDIETKDCIVVKREK